MEVLDVVFRGIAALATVVGAGGIFFAIYQLRFNAWLKAQEIFTRKEFVDARTKVFAKPDDYNGPWEDTDYYVCRRMDELVRLIPYLPAKVVLDTWYDPIAKAWKKLEKLVTEERKKAGWPTKWGAFEKTAREAIKRLESAESKAKRLK
jgi:hypothetical protein